MKVTSAQANKILKKIMEEYEALKLRESQTKDFLASINENPDSIRPKYDFLATQDALEDYEKKIRKMKHAINVFNSTTMVEGFDITVDEMLILIPQLTKAKAKLFEMKSRLPKMREEQTRYMPNSIIDYRYTNYDVEEVARKYKEVSETLSNAQLALDNVNSSVEFEFDC